MCVVGCWAWSFALGCLDAGAAAAAAMVGRRMLVRKPG